jgi:NAD+ diphosphatase
VRDGQILLARSGRFKGNLHSVIAGFVEPGETLEECARREVMEEVGLEIKNLKYFGSQEWPYPDSIMIGFVCEYLGGEIKIDNREIVSADWFSAGSLPNIPGNLSIARRLIDWFIENNK